VDEFLGSVIMWQTLQAFTVCCADILALSLLHFQRCGSIQSSSPKVRTIETSVDVTEIGAHRFLLKEEHLLL